MNDLPKICDICGQKYEASASFCALDGASLTSPTDVDRYVGRVLLEQFTIEERIGAGGMGAVYRAHQKGVDRKVAVKILHADLTSNPDAVRRFQREATVAAAIDHPNVVRIFLYGELDDGNGYIVMEHLVGKSLFEVLEEERVLALDRALHIAIQVCMGVGEAHSHRVVHRDIKPDNILLVTRGGDQDFVKVLDFGVARLTQTDRGSATQAGLVFGTARYISPEGAAGELTDSRSDVYSIGVVLYQMLCGETPFDAATPVALLMKHINERTPKLRSRKHGASVPEAVANIVERALSKEPAKRYADAHALKEALLRVADELKIDARLGADSDAPRPSASRPNIAVVGAYDDANISFSTSSEMAAISGLGRESAWPWSYAIIGFLLAGGAVFAGLGGHAWHKQQAREEHISDLLLQTQNALARGAYDAPPHDNVNELSASVLALDPARKAAIDLRVAAAAALVLEGARAMSDSFFDEALGEYTRAHALDPNNHEASAGIEAARAQLDHARSVRGEREVGVEESRHNANSGSKPPFHAVAGSHGRPESTNPVTTAPTPASTVVVPAVVPNAAPPDRVNWDLPPDSAHPTTATSPTSTNVNPNPRPPSVVQPTNTDPPAPPPAWTGQ